MAAAIVISFRSSGPYSKRFFLKTPAMWPPEPHPFNLFQLIGFSKDVNICLQPRCRRRNHCAKGTLTISCNATGGRPTLDSLGGPHAQHLEQGTAVSATPRDRSMAVNLRGMSRADVNSREHIGALDVSVKRSVKCSFSLLFQVIGPYMTHTCSRRLVGFPFKLHSEP